MEKVVERFLKYVQVDTKSNEDSPATPSTSGQLTLAKELGQELQALGLKDVSVDEKGYVMATLPSNINGKIPTVGFIAHLDTSPDMAGANINPKIVENYDGGEVVLNEEMKIILSPADFPDLKNYIGETIITTDGTTLLGADDKAGVAEIVTAVEYLLKHPEIPHGTIRIAFTPDEEIGRGVDHFNVEKFNADFAYTVDGGPLGELEYENFNAAGAKITIFGKNIHPGTAKNKMKNAVLIGCELANMLPEAETPAHTEGYEGFYHLTSFQGEVEQARMSYIIRDFALEKFAARKDLMRRIVEQLNAKYGEGTVLLELKDQYFNMKEKILEAKDVLDTAFEAIEAVGISPVVKPIRGGTDGARLSFMGLPTPNLFTGGHNFHGKYEYIPVTSMNKAVEVILKIIELYTKKQK